MFLGIFLFCAGILTAGYLPGLPAPAWLLLLLPFAIPLLRPPWLRPILVFALGLAWGIASGHLMLRQQLPEQWAGEDIRVLGRVVELPLQGDNRQRFTMRVESYPELPDRVAAGLPRRLQLTWYAAPQPLATDERWQLQVRLRRPRGMVNPGGFDYQVWLLRRGIGAVGYVREDVGNQKLDSPRAGRLGVWRFQLRQWLLDSVRGDHPDLLLALLVGDRSLIEPERWELLRLTGTNHLIAISGLHVGFVAGLGFLLGQLLGRLLNLLCHRIPAAYLGHTLALSLALGYSALAGFSLPTRRALAMVLVVQLVLLLRRSSRARDGLLWALLAVLWLDPLAAFDMGFWLSFGAVAVLLLAFVGRTGGRLPLGLVKAQWVVFIGLLLPLALLLGSVALAAPVANLLAIPLVTLLVVPSLLLAAVSAPLVPVFSGLALALSEVGVAALVTWLQWLVSWSEGWLNPMVGFTRWSLPVAAICALLILLPRGIPGRWLGYPGLLLAVLLPQAPPAPLQVTVLDVGQGLAVVVRARSRTLVYDTGPAYSERFDAGSAIVVPYLRHRGIRALDKLVISHSHGDHAGGLAGVLRGVPVGELLLGEPHTGEHPQLVDQWHNCHRFAPWQWQEVEFRFLSRPIPADANANDHSCVLLIHYRDQTLLLPGDLEAGGEAALLATGLLPEDISWLQVPHHGSRSSSTAPFLAHTRPRYGVYSSGYRNRHGHPHWQVAERYRRLETRMYNTAHSGAVTFVWRDGQLAEVVQRRVRYRRYWYD